VKLIEKIATIIISVSVLLANVGFVAQFEYCGMDDMVEISINPGDKDFNDHNCEKCCCCCEEEESECNECYQSIDYYSAELDQILLQLNISKLLEFKQTPLYTISYFLENETAGFSVPEFFVDLPPPVFYIISYINNFKSASDSDPFIYSI